MLEFEANELSEATFQKECLEPNLPAIVRGVFAEDFNLSELSSLLSPHRMWSTLGPTHCLPVYVMGHYGGEGQSTATSSSSSIPTVPDCVHYSLQEVFDLWSTSSSSSVAYLKDWHGQEDYQRAGSCLPYRVPEFLGKDWLNAYCDRTNAMKIRGFGEGNSDYRFVYMGARGTWTGFHADVFGTYSWSLNVGGVKLWYFLTPQSNEYYEKEYVGCERPNDIRVMSEIQYFTVVQGKGDLIFVPSGVYHQVHNVSGVECALPVGDSEGHPGPTVEVITSINHNWMNQFCVERVVKSFLAEMSLLTKYYTKEEVVLLCGSEERDKVEAFIESTLLSGTNRNCESVLGLLKFAKNGSDAETQAALDKYISAIIEKKSNLFL